MFLKCFSSQLYPVAIENDCSSTAAYLHFWSVVYMYPYLISIPPRTLSHSLSLLNPSESFYINTRLSHVYFPSSIIIHLLVLLLSSLECENYSHITLTWIWENLWYTCKSHIHNLTYLHKSLVYFYLSVQYSKRDTGLLHTYCWSHQEGILLGNIPLV